MLGVWRELWSEAGGGYIHHLHPSFGAVCSSRSRVSPRSQPKNACAGAPAARVTFSLVRGMERYDVLFSAVSWLECGFRAYSDHSRTLKPQGDVHGPPQWRSSGRICSGLRAVPSVPRRLFFVSTGVVWTSNALFGYLTSYYGSCGCRDVVISST